jgi:hypothetical protein
MREFFQVDPFLCLIFYSSNSKFWYLHNFESTKFDSSHTKAQYKGTTILEDKLFVTKESSKKLLITSKKIKNSRIILFTKWRSSKEQSYMVYMFDTINKKAKTKWCSIYKYLQMLNYITHYLLYILVYTDSFPRFNFRFFFLIYFIVT